jgi:hypothetical protein
MALRPSGDRVSASGGRSGLHYLPAQAKPFAGLLAIGLALAGADAGQAGQAAAQRNEPDRNWVTQRASEAGAWWMLVQTTCHMAAAGKLLEEMNAAMVAIGRSDLQPLVAERIEDPHLDERSRLEMERVMQQAAAARQQAEEMLQVRSTMSANKAGAAGLQRKHWQVARPIRTVADLDAAIKDTERSLARLCEQGSARVRTVLFDPAQGVVGKLR